MRRNTLSLLSHQKSIRDRRIKRISLSEHFRPIAMDIAANYIKIRSLSDIILLDKDIELAKERRLMLEQIKDNQAQAQKRYLDLLAELSKIDQSGVERAFDAIDARLDQENIIQQRDVTRVARKHYKRRLNSNEQPIEVMVRELGQEIPLRKERPYGFQQT